MSDTSAGRADWADQLREGEADVARGDIVQSNVVHARLERVAAELEAEIAVEGFPNR